MDLTLNWNDKIKNTIANSLLSQDRLERKIKHYNGYVGYISQDGYMHYNNDFEEKQLNIYKRH